ncbi:MAG: YgiQ family radical SAM protein [Candidatus Cloacimonetes bacterium]|nr:YgiQ family radical SAM protein [Candidatus Cloacimonadota bacterium]
MPANFLPVSKAEISRLGWEQPDIILISGDAYVDHPSFAAAMIGRWLEYNGYKVAILAQPDWKNPESFQALGKPRLFFGITSGNMDSMINKYTARKKLRSEDAYSPDGCTDMRPDRATLVYSQIVHSLYKDVPIVLGGIEASMRRLPHYDYWSDKLRNSLLFDSRAQYLVYGMGERAILELAEALDRNPQSVPEDIAGTCVLTNSAASDGIILPEFHSKYSAAEFSEMSTIYEKQYRTRVIYQKFAARWLKLNPPSKPLSSQEMDVLYNLPFQREVHPVYAGKKITAFEQICNSVTTHRGCFGGCNFCGIGYHQGKSIQSRSAGSILKEVRELSEKDYFHGAISDLGGPSANMFGMYCQQKIAATCKRTSCLYPAICPHLSTDHKALQNLLKKAARVPGVNHLFVASGIRFDLALRDIDYIRQIAEHHTGGLLKLAPEHKSSRVLELMHKPEFELYQEFLKLFGKYSLEAGKKQAVVPYIIIGHPGATLADTIELALHLKRENVKLRQIQEYIPLPMTASALMYYTGKDENGTDIHIAKGRELRLMKALVQWYIPQNRKLVIEALNNANRRDLIKFFIN